MESFARKHLETLKRFSQIAWGNSQALMRQLPGAAPDVQFLDLGEYFESFEALFNGLLKPPGKILVRDEYRAAVEALETDRWYREGACVLGQPGIGKTVFLFYALVHFLGQRQPVALHQLGGKAFYVLFKETATIHPLDRTKPLSDCGFVWALSDSNPYIRCPPATFTSDPGPIRAIQTSPPEASHWRQWSKQSGASRYVMDIWTEKEIMNLTMLLKLDVECVTAFTKKWGTTPRMMLKFHLFPDVIVENLFREEIAKSIETAPKYIGGGERLDLPGVSPTYCIRPRTRDTGVIARKFATVVVETEAMSELLRKGLDRYDDTVRADFYRVLSRVAETRPAPGYLFDFWFHHFVIAGHQVPCKWVTQGSDDHIWLPTSLSGTTVLAPATREGLKSQTPPYYWVPPYAGFPGIDSVLVLKKEIVAFQVTLNADYMSPMKGLREVRRCLRADLRDRQWRVVFVGRDDELVMRVAEHWGKELSSTGKTPVRVGWSVLIPGSRSDDT